jgi:hypothetical protein
LVLRRTWGYGIAAVLIVAVAPYPVRGIWDSSGIIHRLHNTVGSVQYLPLWAVPVLVWTHRRTDLSMWRLALASSLAIFVAAVWTGDLLGSGSWLPLATLLVLWPDEARWRRVWFRPERVAPLALVAAIFLWWVAAATAPDFLHLQHVSGGDVHGTRYHYGGMATAELAIAAAGSTIVLWRSSRATVLLVSCTAIAVGVAHLVWSEYDSALAGHWAWTTIAAGVLLAPLAFWEWPALQISWLGAAPSRSSSSPRKPTTHS